VPVHGVDEERATQERLMALMTAETTTAERDHVA
jgi:hypothetical protein